MKKYVQLTKEERIKIETLLKEKRSNRYIASFLRRSPSTVGKEISNGSGKDSYNSTYAQSVYLERRKQSKRTSLKVIRIFGIEPYVLKKLKNGWSPERISGYLRRNNVLISTKAIYKYIYKTNKERYLFWHKYTKKTSFKNQHSFTGDNRKYIDKRPYIQTHGHFEMDFIVSGKSKTSLLILVDKVTRKVYISKLKDKKRDTINKVLLKRLSSPKSITTDNDVVFQHWRQIESLLNTKVYFTRPYHSYEKGLIENTNRWIRAFLPKHTDFNTISIQKIAYIERYLNTIPRKILNFKSSNELEEELQVSRFKG